MARELKRPKWRIGQVLIPAHFFGMEDALSQESAIRSTLTGLPTHGLYRLEWNGEEPKNGVLWVYSMGAVLPDGTLVDVPGNARLEASLDMKAVGKRNIEVYAHILPPEEDDDAKPEETSLEPPSASDIPRSSFRVKLSSDASMEGTIGRVELGHFEMNTAGTFRLSSHYVPPFTRLFATPYFSQRFVRLKGEIAEIEGSLDDLAMEAIARGDSAAPLHRVRIEARKVSGLLADMEKGLQLHPYPVFEALRSFALELCILDERSAPFTPPAYNHYDLATCFGVVFDEISSRVRVPLPEEPAVPFVLENGRYLAADLPADAMSAPELYIVVLKSRVSDKVPLDGTVLASPGRLRLVREHSLRGMRASYSPNPPFRHRFGGPVDFFRIVGAGAQAGDDSREWNSVVREKGIGFLALKELEGMRVLLSWRRP